MHSLCMLHALSQSEKEVWKEKKERRWRADKREEVKLARRQAYPPRRRGSSLGRKEEDQPYHVTPLCNIAAERGRRNIRPVDRLTLEFGADRDFNGSRTRGRDQSYSRVRGGKRSRVHGHKSAGYTAVRRKVDLTDESTSSIKTNVLPPATDSNPPRDERSNSDLPKNRAGLNLDSNADSSRKDTLRPPLS